MRISIFGLGYVGTVSAACLARLGNIIVGVDINSGKVDAIRRGTSPIVEPGVEMLLKDAVAAGRLTATTDAETAIQNTDLSLICVGTPSNSNGGLNATGVLAVAREIGEVLKRKAGYHGIAIRSTVMPGTNERAIQIIAEVSGKAPGIDFGVASNPEFLREGTAVLDFEAPPFTIVGTSHACIEELLRGLYEPLDSPYLVVDVKVAELLKYACNSFHAVKVTFANEIGSLCKLLGVDSYSLMNLFTKDCKLNISAQYLKPGFAFGGSCLPKDLRALSHAAKQLDLEIPMLESVMRSNEAQIQRVADRILATGKKRIGILGLSFKSDTDDLRESPIVRVVEFLIGKGCQVSIYDANVNVARLVGANKRFIEEEIPHISCHMKLSADEVVKVSDVIVLSNNGREFHGALGACRQEQVVLDLVHITDDSRSIGASYDGLYW